MEAKAIKRGPKGDEVRLVEHRRAHNILIELSGIRKPFDEIKVGGWGRGGRGAGGGGLVGGGGDETPVVREGFVSVQFGGRENEKGGRTECTQACCQRAPGPAAPPQPLGLGVTGLPQ
jgi:hypothetical protein